MKIGVPREVWPGERRVAATGDTVKKLVQLGYEVVVESRAGEESNIADLAYESAGATVVSDAREVWSEADLILKVRPPTDHPELRTHEADLMREGATLISFVWPAQNRELLDRIATRKATVLAMDQVPRITRAQKMDALSSMANISGYRAVIEAANAFGRSFMGQITAAGKVPPARVLVIGAGVAGLAAIGVARGLGALVRAFDTRPVVKEQVQSMGAEFLELDISEDGSGQGGYAKEMSKAFIEAEMALFAAQARDVDIIITTAQIPGKRAPILITREMVESMREGSVIVDLAAEQGGNCEVTVPGEVIEHNGVMVIGLTDLPSRLPSTSSQLYATNLYHLLQELGKTASDFRIDLEDEVVRGALVLHRGELTWPPPPRPKPETPVAAPNVAVLAKPAAGAGTTGATGAGGTAGVSDVEVSSGRGAGHGHGHGHGKGGDPPSTTRTVVTLLVGGAVLGLLGLSAPREFLAHFTVFVLACFIGWQVVWNVTAALHTPLMSVTNAISGIILVGGMLQLTAEASWLQLGLGALAVLIATINIVGGFMVTQRMLMMFRR